jgi:hypothetical protein
MIMTLLTRRPFEPWTIAGEYKTHGKIDARRNELARAFAFPFPGLSYGQRLSLSKILYCDKKTAQKDLKRLNDELISSGLFPPLPE